MEFRTVIASWRPRAQLLLLASAGVVAGHRIAYWAAPHVHGDGMSHAELGHGYLPYLAALLIPLAAIILARVAWLEHRDGTRRLSFSRLVAAQMVLFVAQESAERAALGGLPLEVLAEDVLWVGLLAQLFVAGVLLGFVRTVPRAVPQLTRPLPCPRPNPVESVARPSLAVVASGVFSPLSGRGPPAWSLS